MRDVVRGLAMMWRPHRRAYFWAATSALYAEPLAEVSQGSMRLWASLPAPSTSLPITTGLEVGMPWSPGGRLRRYGRGGAAADAFSRGGGFAAVGGAGVPGPIVPGAGDRVADTDDGAGGGDDVAWEVELVVSRLPARSIKCYFWWAAQRLLAVVTWPVKVRETAAKVFGERTRRRPLVETGPTTFIAGSGMNSRSMA